MNDEMLKALINKPYTRSLRKGDRVVVLSKDEIRELSSGDVYFADDMYVYCDMQYEVESMNPYGKTANLKGIHEYSDVSEWVFDPRWLRKVES